VVERHADFYVDPAARRSSATMRPSKRAGNGADALWCGQWGHVTAAGRLATGAVHSAQAGERASFYYGVTVRSPRSPVDGTILSDREGFDLAVADSDPGPDQTSLADKRIPRVMRFVGLSYIAIQICFGGYR
jgi:hypothetical protein